jgi:hypothetical protein
VVWPLHFERYQRALGQNHLLFECLLLPLFVDGAGAEGGEADGSKKNDNVGELLAIGEATMSELRIQVLGAANCGTA